MEEKKTKTMNLNSFPYLKLERIFSDLRAWYPNCSVIHSSMACKFSLSSGFMSPLKDGFNEPLILSVLHRHCVPTQNSPIPFADVVYPSAGLEHDLYGAAVQQPRSVLGVVGGVGIIVQLVHMPKQT